MVPPDGGMSQVVPMEAMFLRFWLRTRVLNDHLPEVFFQNLDERWGQVYTQVETLLTRYSGPLVQ